MILDLLLLLFANRPNYRYESLLFEVEKRIIISILQLDSIT